MDEVFSGTSIKDTWTKPRVGCNQRREVRMVGVRGRGVGKWETTVLEQQ